MKIKALKPNGKKKRRGRPRGKLLRGERLVKAARMALAHMGTLSPKTDPINIARLAARLQVTRQAIYDNNLKEVVARSDCPPPSVRGTNHHVRKRESRIASSIGRLDRAVGDRWNTMQRCKGSMRIRSLRQCRRHSERR
jgi:hypothetical protein